MSFQNTSFLICEVENDDGFWGSKGNSECGYMRRIWKCMEGGRDAVRLWELFLQSCVLRWIFAILSPGEAYMRLSKLPEAEHWYMESLRSKTDHIPAHLTYGKLLALTVSD